MHMHLFAMFWKVGKRKRC